MGGKETAHAALSKLMCACITSSLSNQTQVYLVKGQMCSIDKKHSTQEGTQS